MTNKSRKSHRTTSKRQTIADFPNNFKFRIYSPPQRWRRTVEEGREAWWSWHDIVSHLSSPPPDIIPFVLISLPNFAWLSIWIYGPRSIRKWNKFHSTCNSSVAYSRRCVGLLQERKETCSVPGSWSATMALEGKDSRSYHGKKLCLPEVKMQVAGHRYGACCLIRLRWGSASNPSIQYSSGISYNTAVLPSWGPRVASVQNTRKLTPRLLKVGLNRSTAAFDNALPDTFSPAFVLLQRSSRIFLFHFADDSLPTVPLWKGTRVFIAPRKKQHFSRML